MIMRSRLLSPEFFSDPDLGTMSSDALLLFQGLWLLSDREGYVEFNAKQISAMLFPYRDFDVDKHLSELCGKNPQIVYIDIDGMRYIRIINLLKHQSIPEHEKKSRIPPEIISNVNTLLKQCEYNVNTLQKNILYHSAIYTYTTDATTIFIKKTAAQEKKETAEISESKKETADNIGKIDTEQQDTVEFLMAHRPAFMKQGQK